MLRKINILGETTADRFLADDFEVYQKLNCTSSEDLLKNILFSGFAQHFHLRIPELVYTTNDGGDLNRLYCKQNTAIQAIDHFYKTSWNRFDLSYFLNPEYIIYHLLIRKYLGELMPQWNWVVIHDTKNQWSWSPFVISSVKDEKSVAKQWIPMFSKELIDETIENFFGLIDYKINDIIIFTLASFVELWQHDKELREKWSQQLLSDEHVQQFKKQAKIYIYQFL